MFETIARQYRMKLNLQLFAGDGGGEGGGSGGDGGDGGTAGGGDKTFTQAEVDAMMGQRLPRAEKAAQKALAKELGYDSVEAMQTALKKQEPPKKKDGEQDEPVDVEALVEEKLKAKQKEQDERTFKRLLTAEVKVLANELGFADWEDALALGDFSEVEEDDKGNLTGVKEVMEELLKKKPHLGKQKPGGAFGATVPNSQEQRRKSQEALINLAKSRGAVGGQAAYNPWAQK